MAADKKLDYQGYTDLAILQNGDFIAPASAAAGEYLAKAEWTSQGYQVAEDQMPDLLSAPDGVFARLDWDGFVLA